MDVNLVEFEAFFEKLLVHLCSILSFRIVKRLAFREGKDASDTLCHNVVLVDHPDWLQCVRLNHFKVGVTALEVIEAANELDGEGVSAVVFQEDLDDVHNHLSLSKHSIRWFASEAKGEILPG